MESHHKEHTTNGFSNGFLLGVIVGAIIVFLLVTKKGKRILKTLTENGFEGVSELTDMFLEDDEDEEGYEEEYTSEGPQSKASQRPAGRPVKRFFKGIKR